MLRVALARAGEIETMPVSGTIDRGPVVRQRGAMFLGLEERRFAFLLTSCHVLYAIVLSLLDQPLLAASPISLQHTHHKPGADGTPTR
jgi:hypothetical protein